MRTLPGEVEDRIGTALKPDHPVIAWLVEYVAALISKHHMTSDGTTAYQNLHGQIASERLAQFGEKIHLFVPNRRRSKLDVVWPAGVVFGT